jgi:hypothetical protein
MNRLETAPYQPLHAQPNPDIATLARDVVDRAQTAMRNTFAYVHTAVVTHAEQTTERLQDASAMRRRFARIGSVGVLATVSILAARTTGAAAHGLDAMGVLPDMPTGSGPGRSFIDHAHAPAQQPPKAETGHHEMMLAAHAFHADTGDLPADLDVAPDLGPLGEYNARTGAGTIWHQVVEYADKMGYDDLTERQKHTLVGKTLDHMGLSWADARHMHADYRPDLPDQHTVQSWLNDVDADRTHSADRVVDVDPPAADDTNNDTAAPPVKPTQPTFEPPTFAAPAIPDVSWWDREIIHIPDLTRTNVDWVNVGAAALPFAFVAGVAGGRKGYTHYSQRRVLRQPTAEHPVVVQQPVVERHSVDKTIPRRTDWQYRPAAPATTGTIDPRLLAPQRRPDEAGDPVVDRDGDGVDDRVQPVAAPIQTPHRRFSWPFGRRGHGVPAVHRRGLLSLIKR